MINKNEMKFRKSHRKTAQLHRTLCILFKTSTSVDSIVLIRGCCTQSRQSNLTRMSQVYFFVPDEDLPLDRVITPKVGILPTCKLYFLVELMYFVKLNIMNIVSNKILSKTIRFNMPYTNKRSHSLDSVQFFLQR